jgi:aminoglycoside phosphotransferase (APT) family kinase protein
VYREGDWGRLFAALDYPSARPTPPSTDHVRWHLGDGLAATVWFDRPVTELRLLGDFLDDLAHAGLPFAVPRHLTVDVGPDDLAWTLEPVLDGHPLAGHVPGSSPDLTPAVVEVLLDVHGALADVAPSPGLRRLPVLGEDRALLAGHARFPEALAALAERRLENPAPLLREHVPGLADLASRVVRGLRNIEDPPVGLVHGDLRPPNVLVDDRRTPTAVVGFGVFSTVGDPTFDAAVTASVSDATGPNARQNRDLFDAAFGDHFAYEPDRLSLYRLAYALTTAGAGDAAGGVGVDEHIRWCCDILVGPDVERAFP